VSLLYAKHADPLSAAVSLAENRASKAQLVRADGMGDIADRYARNLFEDVRAFVAFEYAQLAHGEQVPDHVCERLHAATARARGEA
jgi:uncharacterized MAPEG superfamily protein